jgi:D-alanyl-D-alanine carboxypeptidase (penicillin-binding protein 5/6)
MQLRHGIFCFIALMMGALAPMAAQADAPIDTIARQAIVIDYDTGTVLYEKNADEKMHPSSMSKLMLLYIAFSELKAGRLKLTDTFLVSEKAWRTQGSKMFVELGNRIPVEQLLQGIIVQSGNDACIVVAEGIAGSEEAMVARMNRKAAELGLTNSHFDNVTGLPDDNHLMSARDLATLARDIIRDFPDYYHYFAETEFTYHNIRQGNRNPLLERHIGVDGMKTGHTDAGGYGITISGRSQDGRRIIVVVNGLPTDRARGEESEKLLLYAYRNFENVTLAKAGQTILRAPVWMGVQPDVALAPEKDIVLSLPKGGEKHASYVVKYTGPLQAPVKAGEEVATLEISAGGEPVTKIPLVTENAVAKLGFWGRIWPNLMYYVRGHGKG